MSRRSARLQGVVKAVEVVVENTLTNASDDDEFRDIGEEDDAVPKKKRRKGAKSTVARVLCEAFIVNHTSKDSASEDQTSKRVRGRRGMLSSLREFPLDLIAEIFGHLNPLDLLNLARTTKEIRGILMSRSSRFIWKESRSHVEGLPNPPRDLSEPQYANLCFSTHCHQCLAIPVMTIVWSARTRLCKKCMGARFGNYDCVMAQTKLESNLLKLLPSYREPRHGWRRARELFSIDAAMKLKEESADFREYGNIQLSDPKFKAWFTQKEDEIKEINTHAELCITWAANRTNERKNELDEARRLREEAIVERLTALGWGAEITFHTYEFSCHKLVNQPKKLTDRIWNNIKATLVEFLTDLKGKRLVAARVRLMQERRQLAVQVYTKFREALPPDVPYPPKVEVLLTEPFETVTEDTPDEEKLTEESFAAAVSTLPEFLADWRQSKEKELVKIMQKTRPGSVEADLHLATTFFTCSLSNDADPLRLPTILVHKSTTNIRYNEWDFDSVQRTLWEEPWNASGNVRLHAQAQHNARFVVEACGLDPDVTTGTEMDEINPALECLNCCRGDDRYVMRWIRATYHNCRSAVTPSWKCLTLEEERLLEAEENKDLERRFPSYSHSGSQFPHFLCKVCGDSRGMPFFKLKEHLLTEHDISDVTFENLVCALNVGPSEQFPRPIRWNPHRLQEAETKEAEHIHTDEAAVVGNEV
ncbi:hypothetical protein C8R45DRAFT_345014 [Mycena sanguinolenta]|nr:hypothetical protein C8R45DRAFT_345014 [Mycena sanguinolenta]